MKRILTILIIMLSAFTFGQSKIDYPKIEKDANGESVVVMTIEQAQKLDNNTDLLILYKQLGEECALRDQLCVKVVNDKDKVIASQVLEISKLVEYNNTKESQIVTLQNTITEYQNKCSLLVAQVDNRQKVVTEKDLQIGILKSRFRWTGIGAGVIITVLTTLLIIK